MNSAAHAPAASAGRAMERSVATGRAPIAATSLRFTARDLPPSSRGVVAARRKWTPSVSRSAVKTSDSPPPRGSTAQSSPMPSNPLSGREAKRVCICSINPNSVMCISCCYGQRYRNLPKIAISGFAEDTPARQNAGKLAFALAYSHFDCGAVTALLECRDLLPDRLRFGFGTARSFSIAGMFQILSPGKMQVNLLLPSLIRSLAVPKILTPGNVQINLTLPSLIRIFAEV